MSLSKKNLDKLNSLIKKNNLLKNNNPVKDNHSNDYKYKSKRSTKVNDPNKTFYSIIDNSTDINEASEAIRSLKNNEDNFADLNTDKTNCSKNLTMQDKLYDEFNYLLDD